MTDGPDILYLYQYSHEGNNRPGTLEGDGTTADIVEEDAGCNKGQEGVATDERLYGWLQRAGVPYLYKR